MAWIRVDDQMPDHPKVEPLSDAAFRWIFKGLSYANRFLTNGVLPPVFLERVPAGVQDELVAGRIWKRGKDGKVRIHDYRDYQPLKSEVTKKRQTNNARQTKFRERLKAAREREIAHSPSDASRERNAVSHATPTQPNPTRPGTTNTPPKSPAGAGDRKRGLRRDRQDAALVLRNSREGCFHDPPCDGYRTCLERTAADIRAKREHTLERAS